MHTQIVKMEQILDLLHPLNDAFALPPTPPRDPSSDTSMAEESREERPLRYQQSDQCEVSDPDRWATVHYGAPDQQEPMEGLTEHEF